MQRVTCRAGPARSDWSQLPSELLIRVFKSLSLHELLQAELSCRFWFQALRSPQGSAVWGNLTIELDLLRPRISRDRLPASDSQLYLRTCRWLKAHASGIASLMLHNGLGRLSSLTSLKLWGLRYPDSGFDPACLSRSSQLRFLHLYNMTAKDFQVPNAWASLETLALQWTQMSELPGNLSALSSLTRLTIEGDFQITEPLEFLTQLANLRIVELHRSHGDWSSESLFDLVDGRLLMDSAPDCCVRLVDT
ncbi:hypothetical protein WJX73_001300 [Symbiochloris irregularis]|uniref:F-box domain-containing protein n=1 Tax=Symbiochloris irregularis TaxID=706552 RepID=A0AAW1PMT5_9CHLO